jgi:endonuclease/exonuclease/phosphatase (EEP) superfamily protein YafD
MWTWILAACCGLLVVFTLLPFSKRPEWWIRGCDFPRFQFAVFGTAIIAAGSFLLDRTHSLSWIIVGAALLCTACQVWWIFPYTPLHRREVKTAPRDRSSAPRIRIMTANVLMTNRRTADFLAIVRREQPDVLVTLETNRWWEQQLAPLEHDYPHTLKCPLENLYGMHLYSRLPLEDSRLQFLIEPDIPSMHTLVVLSSQQRVRLHCLHPAPPSPTENETSRERDAELIMVGKAVVGASLPVIVAGDLNDVAWSATTRLFRKISCLLDPRIGRGRYNTYHARFPFSRWPVDHFFHSTHFTCVQIKRLPFFGSDHFPVLLELALTHTPQQPAVRADADDHQDAEEKLDAKAADESEVHRPGEGERPRSTAHSSLHPRQS